MKSWSGPALAMRGRDQETFLIAESAAHEEACAQQLIDALGGQRLAHVLVFASARSDFQRLMKTLHEALFCPVVGCTTAGEIGRQGYVDDKVIAVLADDKRMDHITLLGNLGQVEDLTPHIDRLSRDRIALSLANPKMKPGFAFMMVDGLCRFEDELVNALSPALGDFALFGGSAGDGLKFERAYVGYGGKVHRNAATITMVVTHCRTQVFSINLMAPTTTRMVVTEADPARRIVRRINAEPAAEEYARLIGKAPGQLDEMIFAAHPVTVGVGSQHHVRAIQRVTPEGELVFFSAIDEGMVLTVAQPRDMAGDLDDKLTKLVNGYARPSIIGCDCVLRRIEAERGQMTSRVNEAIRKHSIVGFSTYGEQIGTLHVNHTMTGVAVFPPDPGERH